MPTQTPTKPRTIPGSPRWTSPLKTADGRILPTRGPAKRRWIEDNLLLGEGDYYGQPFRFRKFQARFFDRLNEYDPENGDRRRYRVGLLMMAKGNGKTPIAAVVGGDELVGPFAPISPRVTIGAASLENADLVFGDLKAAVTGPEDAPSPMRPFVEPYDIEVLLKGQPGRAERIAAVSSTNDGGRTTVFIGDELHEWLTNKQKRVWLVVSGAVAKRRNGFTLGISTAGVNGNDSPLEALYEYGVKVAQGVIQDDAFLFESYEAPDGLDLDDPDQWLEAVLAANPGANPAACEDDGDFKGRKPFVDVEAIRYRFQTIPRFEFERYHLNRWTQALNEWIPLEVWDRGKVEPEFKPKETVWIGAAGRSRRDAYAVYVVKQGFAVEGRLFEPEGDDEIVNEGPVKDYIRSLWRQFDVRQVRFTPLLFDIAAELEGEGMAMWEVKQSKERIISYSQALFDAAVKENLQHGGDPVLREQVQAAKAKATDGGYMLQGDNISAIIATAMAVEAARDNAGEKKKPGKWATF